LIALVFLWWSLRNFKGIEKNEVENKPVKDAE
jgi:hypothetical protein